MLQIFYRNNNIYLGADLITALADLQMANFAHDFLFFFLIIKKKKIAQIKLFVYPVDSVRNENWGGGRGRRSVANNACGR